MALKTDTTKPTRNLKRSFNRLFIVATVAWVVYCSVIFPLQEQNEDFKRGFEIYSLQQNLCHEKALHNGGNAEELNACLKVSEDAWEVRRTEHCIWRVYAADWPFILLRIVGLPLVAYGTIRGIAAICLWVWRGYRET
jgi:hypothetical protein